MAAHGLADWAYSVSETVASWTLTGVIGFVVVKWLQLDRRRPSDIPWTDVIYVAIGLACAVLTVPVAAGEYRHHNYAGLVLPGMMILAFIVLSMDTALDKTRFFSDRLFLRAGLAVAIFTPLGLLCLGVFVLSVKEHYWFLALLFLSVTCASLLYPIWAGWRLYRYRAQLQQMHVESRREMG